jgi:tRNA G18 (ribose-2'-O)-methylase SpoU
MAHFDDSRSAVRLSRRAALQIGCAGLGTVGSFWGNWLNLAAAGVNERQQRAKSVILIEGAGLDPELVSQCDERVTIPMASPVESLNVAVAGAILIYAARRQRL